MDNNADVVLTGELTGNTYGFSVSSAGDVDSNSYDDVIVGAPAYNSSTGRAYIYFGTLSMDSTPDVILTGEAANSSFGVSVSKAGDVNNDGYNDVIVGASDYNSSIGRAYIYFGSLSMDSAPDVILTGEAINSNFGISVSDADDLNKDGYDDVVIGADGYNSGTGRVYVFYGGDPMDNLVDEIVTGEIAGDSFGYCVEKAGDVNGDLLSDIIVGAHSYGSDGKAYLYSDEAGSVPVQLNNFYAEADQDGNITLGWTTQSEVDCAGFHIWKSISVNDNYQRITSELIPGRGNSSIEHEYKYTDIEFKEGVVYWYRLEEISIYNNSSFFGPISAFGRKSLPKEYYLSQNYPNPFNPVTNFKYNLPEDTNVTICIYNTKGERVKTIINKYQKADFYQETWAGNDEQGIPVSSGLYIIRIQADDFHAVEKITLMK